MKFRTSPSAIGRNWVSAKWQCVMGERLTRDPDFKRLANKPTSSQRNDVAMMMGNASLFVGALGCKATGPTQRHWAVMALAFKHNLPPPFQFAHVSATNASEPVSRLHQDVAAEQVASGTYVTYLPISMCREPEHCSLKCLSLDVPSDLDRDRVLQGMAMCGAELVQQNTSRIS